jgi:hypothetical protein
VVTCQRRNLSRQPAKEIETGANMRHSLADVTREYREVGPLSRDGADKRLDLVALGNAKMQITRENNPGHTSLLSPCERRRESSALVDFHCNSQSRVCNG